MPIITNFCPYKTNCKKLNLWSDYFTVGLKAYKVAVKCIDLKWLIIVGSFWSIHKCAPTPLIILSTSVSHILFKSPLDLGHLHRTSQKFTLQLAHWQHLQNKIFSPTEQNIFHTLLLLLTTQKHYWSNEIMCKMTICIWTKALEPTHLLCLLRFTAMTKTQNNQH